MKSKTPFNFIRFTCRFSDFSKMSYRIIGVVSIVSILSACQSLWDIYPFSERQIQSIETNHFVLKPNENVIGQLAVVEVKEGETLPDIARHFSLGYDEITQANNQLDVWAPGDGRRVLLPLRFILPDAPRDGIVLNLADMRLFYYSEGLRRFKIVTTYSAGIGREGWATPLGKSRIIGKRKMPKWHVPASIRREQASKGVPLPAVVLPGPDNPLGEYAMRLSMPSYLIHGTNKPYGVGLRVSHGCVRLYPENIEALFQQVSVGTPVQIVDQPYLAGWQDGMLYLEAHQPEKSNRRLKELLFDKLKRYSRTASVEIDWNKVADTLAKATGIPAPILVGSYADTKAFYDIPTVARPQKLNWMPVVHPLKSGDWSVLIGTFLEQTNAVQLAAILNHQGPQIPARVVERNRSYRVAAGPFRNRKQAQEISRRIQRELEIDSLVTRAD